MALSVWLLFPVDCLNTQPFLNTVMLVILNETKPSFSLVSLKNLTQVFYLHFWFIIPTAGLDYPAPKCLPPSNDRGVSIDQTNRI